MVNKYPDVSYPTTDDSNLLNMVRSDCSSERKTGVLISEIGIKESGVFYLTIVDIRTAGGSSGLHSICGKACIKVIDIHSVEIPRQ